MADRFLSPNLIPIFFHGLSERLFGLPASSPDGGVIGGVTGSSGLGIGLLDCQLPESSVKATEPVSPLAVETGPTERPAFPGVGIAVRAGKFDERVDWAPPDSRSPVDDWGDTRFPFELTLPLLHAWSSRPGPGTTLTFSALEVRPKKAE